LLGELICFIGGIFPEFPPFVIHKKLLIIKPNDMKNRILPFAFFTLFAGFAFLFTSYTSYAGNPGSVTKITNTIPSASRSTNDPLQQIRVNQNTGKVDPVDVLRAQEQIRRQTPKSVSALDLNWIPLGPNNASGRTRGLIYDKNDVNGETIYTGGVTGGVWRSTNGGLTWEQQNTAGNEVLRVTCFTQTSDGTIYAGTGESFCNHDQFPGTGIYRSTDGINFTVIDATKPVPNDTTAH